LAGIRTENREQRTENREQRSENREQRTEIRDQGTIIYYDKMDKRDQKSLKLDSIFEDLNSFVVAFSKGVDNYVGEQIIASLKKIGFRYVSLELEGYITGSSNPEKIYYECKGS
jgi:hypothetical protein